MNPKLKKLVVYYSLEGNTRFIAEKIAAATGADVLEIKTKTQNKVSHVTGGIRTLFNNFSHKIPEILPQNITVQDYDLIFIGTPVWSFSYTPAIKAFLVKAELQGKNIALFCCYGGMAGKTFINLEKALSGNNIVGKIGLKEPLKSDREENVERVNQWVNELIQRNE